MTLTVSLGKKKARMIDCGASARSDSRTLRCLLFLVYSFIPPDGEFELMTYRTTENIKIPFKVFPIVKEHSTTRLELKVTVKSVFQQDRTADDVVVKIPIPK